MRTIFDNTYQTKIKYLIEQQVINKDTFSNLFILEELKNFE